ncbi:Crp/Fnr family transcriptional regulator [Danxiaibacter flavus]|uniref:Crp/Fnr family transcriptional regulator n=1 Tax=Danxiaibacter flavus TaxID=3049108 RepID=A0ABV3ZES9_9BACT|nr:Crp/Fnr family transcriptional regulator [Chitinophagaceae bacterium DXS]
MLERVQMEKGRILFKEGKIETDIYFIEQGAARAYCNTEESELTFWFGFEGDIVLSYNGYVYNKPGYESVELLENAILYKLKGEDLQELFNHDIALANWGRKLAEQELIKTEERFITRQSKSATERYQELLDTTPHLIQRVQLGYVASYLGITQVSLSRIRQQK